MSDSKPKESPAIRFRARAYETSTPLVFARLRSTAERQHGRLVLALAERALAIESARGEPRTSQDKPAALNHEKTSTSNSPSPQALIKMIGF